MVVMFVALGRRTSVSTMIKRKPVEDSERLKVVGIPIVGGDATTVVCLS